MAEDWNYAAAVAEACYGGSGVAGELADGAGWRLAELAEDMAAACADVQTGLEAVPVPAVTYADGSAVLTWADGSSLRIHAWADGVTSGAYAVGRDGFRADVLAEAADVRLEPLAEAVDWEASVAVRHGSGSVAEDRAPRLAEAVRAYVSAAEACGRDVLDAAAEAARWAAEGAGHAGAEVGRTDGWASAKRAGALAGGRA